MRRKITKNVSELKNDELSESPLGFLLFQTSRNYYHYLDEYLNEMNIALSQVYFLLALYNKDHVSQEYLADILGLSEGTVTKSIRSLSHKHLVKRERNTEDKRKKIVILTEEGRSLVDEFHEVIGDFNSELLKDFTREELYILRILLKKMALVLDSNTD